VCSSGEISAACPQYSQEFRQNHRLATDRSAATACWPMAGWSLRGETNQAAASVATTVTSRAGKIRRIRRAQNPRNENVPVCSSPRRMPVIRNPEITKKTSTPTKPPGIQRKPRWNSTTATTATARRPSISARYPAPGAVIVDPAASRQDSLQRRVS
jgi:hypothetical protein